jgi:drug/metabolite transporter (DMT)-like permease
MPSSHLRRKALQALLLCTVLWALSFSAMKTLGMAQQAMLLSAGSVFISALCVTSRFLVAGILLLMFSVPQVKTMSRREAEQGVCLGFFASAGIFLQMDGLAYVSASTSAFLTQLYCVLIPIWMSVRHQRHPTLKIFISGVLVLIGMAVLVNLNPLAIRLGRGELETLASSFLFTAQILCLEHPRYAANRSQCFTTVMLLFMGLFALPVALATAPVAADCIKAYCSGPAIGILGILVLVCSISPFLLMNRWQREVTATEAGLIYCTEPVVVSILALFLPAWLSRWAGVDYPNEQISFRLLLGGGLITAANVLLQLPWLAPRRKNG